MPGLYHTNFQGRGLPCRAKYNCAYGTQGNKEQVTQQSLIIQQLQETVVTELERVKEVEPQVTDRLHSLENGSAHLVDLEFRVKSEESLVRKLYKTGEDIHQVTDLLRYTYLVSDDNEFTSTAVQVKLVLLKDGYTLVRQANKFQEGALYKDFKFIVRSPSGFNVEIQFHTEASRAAKLKLHPLYEQARVLDKELPQYKALVEQMREISAQVPHPVGVDKFRSEGSSL